jgi:hypothetical protein
MPSSNAFGRSNVQMSVRMGDLRTFGGRDDYSGMSLKRRLLVELIYCRIEKVAFALLQHL